MPSFPQLFNYQRYDVSIQQALLTVGVNGLRPLLSLLLAVLLVISCSNIEQRPLALAWLGIALIATLAGLLYRRYWQKRLQDTLEATTLKLAEWWGIGYALLTALVWGSSSQFMQPDQDSNLLIAMIYFGVCAGAATLSVMGMAHMTVGAVLAFCLFILPIAENYPSHGLWFIGMLALYHGIVLMSARQRLDIVVQNLLLTAKQGILLQSQRQETVRANRANQDKSAFLAAASHDLRQPVHAIMLLGHALQLKTRDDESRVLVTQMLMAGKALSDQFNSLMELSRLESGNYVLNLQTQALADFLRRKQLAFEGVASSHGIELQLRMDKRLLSYGLCTDISLMNRVLDNLLDNALKFSPVGTRVLLSARLHGQRLQLGVHDQGRGIPTNERENVFLPHVQLNNPTRDRGQGIGLGLSIVKEAAQLLQADLRLRSRPGQGSHFLLTLPADMLQRQASGVRDSGVERPHSPHDAVDKLQGKHLLIVEDDPMVASALRQWATSRGMQVSHQSEPGNVTSLHTVDLVICDIRLPSEEDGIVWLSRWLEEWPDVGGVLVSGESGENVHERAEQEGLMLLAKPVDPDLLLQALRNLVR